MFMDPFTSFEEVDMMILAQQAQSRAETEADDLSLTRGDHLIMASATPAKKVLKKKDPATPAAAAKPVAANKAPAPKPAKAAAKKEGRATPEGYVGLNELAKEFDTSTAVIRRKLRNSDLEKPEGHSWQFKDGSKDLAAVRKLLTVKPAKEAAAK